MLSRSRRAPSCGDEAAGNPTAVLLSRQSSRHGGCCSGFDSLRGVVKASAWLGAGQLAAAGFAFRLLTRNSVGVCAGRRLVRRGSC